jgi:hypothetical protein
MLVSDLFANMSDFSGDNFCFETEAALDVIDDMLARNVERGKLTIIKRHKVAKIITFNNRIASLQAIDLDNLVCNQITGWMFVDATRDGYILPIVGIEHVTGTESRDETGEPHAPTAADTLMTTEFIFCPYKHPTEAGGEVEDCYVAELQTGTPRETEGMAIFPSGLRKRRIVPFTRIVEQDIAAEYNPGPRAKFFRDSVGIGYHPIVIPSGDGISPATIPTKPFQIPFGALVPIHFTNYLSGGMTIGATYVASRAYQAPSVEWAIGEAAGEAAAYCAGYQIYTHELLETPEHVRGLQDWLVTKRGVPLYWYDDVKPSDPDFAEAQLEPFDEPGKHESSATLHYRQ